MSQSMIKNALTLALNYCILKNDVHNSINESATKSEIRNCISSVMTRQINALKTEQDKVSIQRFVHKREASENQIKVSIFFICDRS